MTGGRIGSNNAQTSAGMRRASLARFIGRASTGLQLPYAWADGRQESCSVLVPQTDVFPRSSYAPRWLHPLAGLVCRPEFHRGLLRIEVDGAVFLTRRAATLAQSEAYAWV